MNILLDLLPCSVRIDGTEYLFRPAYRTAIRCEKLMQETDRPDGERIIEALNLYYPKIPHDTLKAVDRLTWFYRCGEDPEQPIPQDDGEKDDEEDAEALEQKRTYDYDYDADYIYAAFWAQYGIDLQKENLHWWKFRALFRGLEEGREIIKIIGYRTARITSSMSKEQKAFYRKMKRIYALPLSEKDRAENDAIVNALMNGGDLTGVLKQ